MTTYCPRYDQREQSPISEPHQAQDLRQARRGTYYSYTYYGCTYYGCTYFGCTHSLVKLAEVLGTYYRYTYFGSPRYLEPTTDYQLPSTKHSLLMTNHSLLVTSHYILRTSYHYSSQARAQLCLDRYDEVRSL